jgi:voltage-gated potassium channel
MINPRFERRLEAGIASLTLRKALSLIVGVATVLAVSAAVLERLIDPEFDTFGQALWFSITTVTTVGYGDLIPQSTAGKLVASALMLIGLGLIPLLTSAVVSILVSQRSREVTDEQRRELARINERLEQLDRRLDKLIG